MKMIFLDKMKKETQIRIFCVVLAIIAGACYFYREFYLSEPVRIVLPFLGLLSSSLILQALVKSRTTRNPDLSPFFSFIGCLFGVFVYFTHLAYYFGIFIYFDSVLLLLLIGFSLFLLWYKKLRSM